MGESTDLSNTKQISVSILGIDVEFSITEDSAALMPMKGKTRGADLYEEARRVLQSLGIAVQERARVVTSGAPSLAGKRWRVFAVDQRREEQNGS
jgi:hypothetical protein